MRHFFNTSPKLRRKEAGGLLAIGGWGTFPLRNNKARNSGTLGYQEEGPMRFIIVVLFLSTIPARARTIYLNYGQWEQMPPSLREMYVTGAIDAFSTITVP